MIAMFENEIRSYVGRDELEQQCLVLLRRMLDRELACDCDGDESAPCGCSDAACAAFLLIRAYQPGGLDFQVEVTEE